MSSVPVFYGYKIIVDENKIKKFNDSIEICVLNQLGNNKIHMNDVYNNFVLSNKGNVYLENKIAPKYKPMYESPTFLGPTDTIMAAITSENWKTTHTIPMYITSPSEYNTNVPPRPEFVFCKPEQYIDGNAESRKSIFIHSLVTALDKQSPPNDNYTNNYNYEFKTKINNIYNVFKHSQTLLEGDEYSNNYIKNNEVDYSFETEWTNEVFRIVKDCVIISFIKSFVEEDRNSAQYSYSNQAIDTLCSEFNPRINLGSVEYKIDKLGQLKIAEYLSTNQYIHSISSDITNNILKMYPLHKIFTNEFINDPSTKFSSLATNDKSFDDTINILSNNKSSYEIYKQQIIGFFNTKIVPQTTTSMNTIVNLATLETFKTANQNIDIIKYFKSLRLSTNVTNLIENMTIAKIDSELPNAVNNTSGFIFRIIAFLMSFFILLYIITDYTQSQKVSYMWISIFLIYFLITFFLLSFYFADTFLAQRKILPNDDYKNKQTYVFMATMLIAICFIAIYFLFKYLFVIFYKYRTGNNPIHLAIAVFVLTLIIAFAVCSGKIISAVYPLTAFYLLDPSRNNEFQRKPDDQKIIDVVTVVLYFIVLAMILIYFAYQGYQYNKFVNLSI